MDHTYTYELLTKQHIDQVVDVFTKAFCRSEPMTQYLHLDEKKYRKFARAVTEKAVEDQLSVVALHHDKVVACALVEDIADAGAIPDFDPKFESILALLEELGKPFFVGKTFEKREIAHLFITAVHEDYRHQRLSTQVNFHAMDIAQKHGFDFVYCEFTHVFNERGVLHHLNNQKKLIGSCVYNQFEINNSKPFEHLAGGANSYLWELTSDAWEKLSKKSEHKKPVIDRLATTV